MPRKLSAIRQFSLQCDTPPQSASTRRASLKKQHSETNEDIGIRISLSAKSLIRTCKPPSVKIAWDDNSQSSDLHLQPQQQPFRRHSHSALDSKNTNNNNNSNNDFANLAWQEKENTKNKLNIFLTHNFQTSETPARDSTKEDFQNLTTTSTSKEPKIIQPLLLHGMHSSNNSNNSTSVTSAQNSNSNLKQIFQKHLRKSKISSPAGSDSEVSQAVVVVPIIERSKPNVDNQEYKNCTNQEMLDKFDDDKCTKFENKRPQTAASPPTASQKRAMFQKRTNSAFTSLNCTPPSSSSTPSQLQSMQSQSFQSPPSSAKTKTNQQDKNKLQSAIRHSRPPLVRASSLPTASTINKPDIQVKTRLRRRIKVAKRGNHSKHANCKDQDHDERKTSDVITMVSLVSPSESEEETDVKLKDDAKLKDEVRTTSASATSPVKNSQQPHSPKKLNLDKHFSLRKTVKQVSFQHSSIHAVRSFSASFPARRASVGANLLLDSAAKKLQKTLEKRGQPDEGLAEAKRRFLHISNDRCQSNVVEMKTAPPTTLATIANNEVQNPPTSENVKSDASNDESKESNNKENENSVNQQKQEEQESLKEKKCWETYCRMTKSGLNVSFDTILRGMLTPTEYRLRRRFSLQATEENDGNMHNAQHENESDPRTGRINE